MKKTVRHPEAAREARALVSDHDGHAKAMVEHKLADRLNQGETDEALRLDQVRREIQGVYDRKEE
ncbi:hypothetical protein Q4F19_07855 [Sphingomonas sp. BIUV-7]|uniref:Uncharacterized protein n=1 Tax=Sphingomonas natans TaxID=3063330 RepID=A0ABT8Y7J5_9SPHN|nr:hypothetical protein [Sphingomonas sp. BIUV-7]MDO6414294.1 hypothetical protein [Sphingomonas sp. BIUV-7]